MADSLHGSGHAKPIHWVGSAKKDLAAFPGRARREVLHAFQKKSKSGSATPRADVATIKRRFAAAVLANRQDTKGKSHDDGTN
jgi:phage-related protein